MRLVWCKNNCVSLLIIFTEFFLLISENFLFLSEYILLKCCFNLFLNISKLPIKVNYFLRYYQCTQCFFLLNYSVNNLSKVYTKHLHCCLNQKIIMNYFWNQKIFIGRVVGSVKYLSFILYGPIFLNYWSVGTSIRNCPGNNFLYLDQARS